MATTLRRLPTFNYRWVTLMDGVRVPLEQATREQLLTALRVAPHYLRHLALPCVYQVCTTFRMSKMCASGIGISFAYLPSGVAYASS